MSEMVERVARAIEDHDFDFGRGLCFSINHIIALEFARVAIAAMREPSSKMKEAGYSEAFQRVEPYGMMHCDRPAFEREGETHVWTAMVDAALA